MLTTVRILQQKLKDLIPGHYHYHLDTTKFVTDNHVDIKIEYFSNLSYSKEDLHIFDLSDEPWRESLAEKLNEICERFKLQSYLIFSHSLKYNYNPTFRNIVYMPHNYFDCVLGWDRNTALQSIDNNERQYFLSCLNRQPRINRIYNFLKIIGKPYFKEMLLSIHNLNDGNSVYNSKDEQYISEWMEDTMWDEWNKLAPTLPTACTNDLDIEHPAYHNAYLNLVTETFIQPNELFLTEKIWKPIACGQMFLVLGPTGVLSYLNDIGFDTYNDIIDHDRYQHISQWKARIAAIHELLDELHELDWAKIYKDTRLRRLANARHFYSGLAVKPSMEYVAKRMSEIRDVEYKYDHHYILNVHNLRSSLYTGLYPINHLFN
jgi:hypothetical protein